jgi:2-polyprenyl-3-methyl-5-hydroxy-6-metoxy-1,4-benzoquinol methylase
LYINEHAVLYADAQFQFEGVNRIAAASTLSEIRRHRKTGSILELGAGGGHFLLEARKHGHEPHAIEPNPIEARWISEKLQIPCESVPLNSRSFNGQQFDIVYHKDVLSHLHDPIGVFGDINKALKMEGLLVFETGNIADVHKHYYKYFSQFSYPDHLFFFGERSIKTLLERTGFKLIKIKRDAILFELILQKSLWAVKDLLKDEESVLTLSAEEERNAVVNSPSVKRRLRSLYRHTNLFLIRIGAILPKRNRPLKLLVIAEKVKTTGADSVARGKSDV